MKSAVLRGREHTLLGGLSAIAEERAAIALSRGGAEKRYAHRDPNEDAACFAIARAGAVAAVADGHWGCGASELVVTRVAEELAPGWIGAETAALGPRWTEAATDAIARLNDAIHGELAAGALEWPRTTLALAVARPDEDLLTWASVGDSHLFAATGDSARELAPPDSGRTPFLGDSRDRLGRGWRAGSETLSGIRALVLATDGLSEPGVGVDDPAAAVAACSARAAARAPDLRALETARAVSECALAAQRRQRAGDNVACAVLWLA